MTALPCVDESCKIISNSLRNFVLHLRTYHPHQRNLTIRCPCGGCGCQFSTAESFRKHVLYRHRREFMACKPAASQTHAFNSAPPADVQHVDHGPEFHDSLPYDKHLARDSFSKVIEDLYLRSSKLRLHIEHSYCIPASTAHQIYESSVEFSLSLLSDMFEVISLRVSELGIFDDELNVYLESSEVHKACKNMSGSLTTLRQLGYVAPVSYDLECLKSSAPQPARRRRGLPVMHYVPILKTLESYLNHEDIVAAIQREPLLSDNLPNYPSGSLYQQHPLFAEEPRALRLCLYSDELELCNPIGGNNKKHKICGVYFQIMNIGERNTSSLQSIHLALLVKWKFVVEFGYSVVLKPLLDDLKILGEQGLSVAVRGGGRLHFRGVVTNLCADNLTMHMLGGFRKCFSSGKVCRFCMADYSELAKLKHEGQCVLRTEQSQDVHVQLVLRDQERMCKVYGVSGPSPLGDLPHFKIPDCLPPDVMHDVIEKLLTLNVKAVLRGLNQTKVCKFSRVLELMSSFQYGVVDNVNKPPDLPCDLMKAKSKIRGSASQKLHLFHLLFLVIGPYIPVTNKYWQLHILLNKICDIILAVNVSKDMVMELARLITEHHNLWVSLVKGCYPPKLHYLLHYPRFLLMFGSLRHVWCFRFESFHLFFKKMAAKCNNFINPTYTLSCRMQKKKCLELSGSMALPPAVNIESMQCSLCLLDLPAEEQVLLTSKLPLSVSEFFVKVSSVRVHGLLVRENCYNILDAVDGDPIFIRVVSIFVIAGEVYVIGRKYLPVEFIENLHAFSVKPVADLTCILAESMLPVQTLHSYCIQGKDILKLKFTPVKG